MSGYFDKGRWVECDTVKKPFEKGTSYDIKISVHNPGNISPEELVRLMTEDMKKPKTQSRKMNGFEIGLSNEIERLHKIEQTVHKAGITKRFWYFLTGEL